LLAAFGLLAGSGWLQDLLAIAHNAGKHPPELMFMLYSLGGALLILAAAVSGGERLAAIARPVTIIGTGALLAFIFHIVVIFAGFRYLLGYFHSVSYAYVLTLTLLVMAATPVWIVLVRWIQRRS
jgi:fucose 4-O-acetylase-like acetyltransferase